LRQSGMDGLVNLPAGRLGLQGSSPAAGVTPQTAGLLLKIPVTD